MKHARSAAALAAAAGTTLAVALAGCSSSSSAAGSNSGNQHQTITMVTSSDTNIQTLWNTKLIPAFEKLHPNITLKLTHTDASNESALFARAVASVKAGQPAPVDVFVDDKGISGLSQAGLLYPITTSNVPNAANILSVDTAIPGAMAYRGSAVVLAYNSQKIANPPTTLTGVLDWVKKHPGQFSYCNPSDGGSGQGFVQAVLDQSLPQAAIDAFVKGENTAQQSQWNAGFATLKSLSDGVYQHTYPTGNTQVLNLLSQGQISLASVWSDMFLSAQQQGAMPSYIKAVSVSSPAMPGGPAYLGVPKNAHDIPDILKLFNWILEPAQQALMVTDIAGFPAIQQSMLPANLQSAFGKLDISLEAPYYSDLAAADMDNQWQRNVP